MKHFFALSLLATLAVTGNRASAQANVAENQSTLLICRRESSVPTAIRARKRHPSRPFRLAINKANALNQAGMGVKVMVNPGVYREFVNVSGITRTPARHSPRSST